MMPSPSLDKILIVDDEPEICEVLKHYLTDVGYAISIASDGSAALGMLGGKNYSAVLLDINMPGVNGITVLKYIQDAGCDTVAIMMSGHGSEKLAVECMKYGAEDYISKPFALEDIRQRIEHALTHRKELIEKRQLQQEKEDFILMLSHDMKNPLTAVIGSIDIVREGCLGEVNAEQGEYLQSAIDSCNEVVFMIENLLDIRKLEAGIKQMAIQTYDVHELIGKVAHQYERSAKHEGIEFSANIEPGVSEIAVDRSAFARVLGNLLGNALKFTPEEGKITVSCRRVTGNGADALKIPGYVPIRPDFLAHDRFIRVSVSDTGDGIPVDELDRIFERYTQFSRKTHSEICTE